MCGFVDSRESAESEGSSISFSSAGIVCSPCCSPSAGPSSKAASVEPATLVTPAEATSQTEVSTRVARLTSESPRAEEGSSKRRRVEFEATPPTVIHLDDSPLTRSRAGIDTTPRIEMEPAVVSAPPTEIPAIVIDQQPAVTGGQISEAAIVVLEVPSSSVLGRASSSAAERGKGVVVDDYESESDLDPDDVRIFEEGITHSVVHAGGLAHILEISSDVNLLGDTEDLVSQFDILCSATENEALWNVPKSDLMNEVAAMGLRVYFAFLSCFFYFYGRYDLNSSFCFSDVHVGN